MAFDTTNLFLSALSPESRDLLVSLSTPMDLPQRTVLYRPNIRPSYGYFIESGIASVVTPMGEGEATEVGFIGAEGIVGALHLLGLAPIPTLCVIQLSARALRIKLAALRKAFHDSIEIREHILDLVQRQSIMVGQIAGCNRTHDVKQRLTRWLLMAQDRTGTNTLNFTQEYLGEMIGARRTTVTAVASDLQRQGLLEYKRGELRILNREDLEMETCDCYQIIRRLFSGLYMRN
jgi:CRP-like cAMP-binding protein